MPSCKVHLYCSRDDLLAAFVNFEEYSRTLFMMADKSWSTELTDHEAELYDRQIRLWGLDSQKRLRAAKVLLIGLNGFGAEIAKNIILAGVKAVTFVDHRKVTSEDRCSQFLIPKESIGKNRAEASLERATSLNPMVDIKAKTENVEDLKNSFFKSFHVVCVTECNTTQLERINRICRNNNVKFFAGDVWGTFGYIFADLVTHEFVEDSIQTKKVQLSEHGEPVEKEKFESITITEKHRDSFVPIRHVLNLYKSGVPKDSDLYYLMLILLGYREKHGKDLLPSERGSNALKAVVEEISQKYDVGDEINDLIESDIYAQVSPVCAIVGGIMGQEIIKTVSQKGTPHNNLFLFDPRTMCGKVFKLGYV